MPDLENRRVRLPSQIALFGDALGPMVGLTGDQAMVTSPKDEAEYDRVRPLRLLTLFGQSKNDLQWHINSYSSGGGSKWTCVPCCSLEEAQAITALMLEAMYAYARGRRDRPGVVNDLDKVQASAATIGQTVPKDILKATLSEQLAGKLKQISTKEAELQACLDDRDAISARLSAISSGDANV